MLGFLYHFNLFWAGLESNKAALKDIENKITENNISLDKITKQFFTDIKTVKDNTTYTEIEKEYNKNIDPYNKALARLAKEKLFYTVKGKVYTRLTENILYNNILAALKTECEKDNSYILNTPIHYKKVIKYFESLVNNEKFFVAFIPKEYHIEYSIRPKNDYYNEISICFWFTRDGYFDKEQIQKAQYKNFDYNVKEVTKNYIKFTQYAKRKTDKLVSDLAQKRKAATYDGVFSGILARDGIEKDLYKNVYLK